MSKENCVINFCRAGMPSVQKRLLPTSWCPLSGRWLDAVFSRLPSSAIVKGMIVFVMWIRPVRYPEDTSVCIDSNTHEWNFLKNGLLTLQGTGVVSFTNPPVLTWHLPTYNILSGHPPLTLGSEVQLCWLLPLTLESQLKVPFSLLLSPLTEKFSSKFWKNYWNLFLQMKHN